jgi:hypothetical protein
MEGPQGARSVFENQIHRRVGAALGPPPVRTGPGGTPKESALQVTTADIIHYPDDCTGRT